MTRSKKLKQAIRARARKTGERYSAARRQVLLARGKRDATAAVRPAPPAVPRPARPAKAAAASRALGGTFSEASVVKKTGHGFDHWFAVLDRFGAAAKGHTASARYLDESQGVPGWHSQMITVAYERARGLRAANQACTGDFQVSVSKTVAAGVTDVVRALGDAGHRARWLRGADPALARGLEAALAGSQARQVTRKRDDYARLRYPWNDATVEIYIYGKPKGRSSVVAQNSGLADADAVEKVRAQWKTALNGLAAYLGG
jgi:hypothetical protein